ncbi:hypothetical protein [Spirillospora sp. NPDC047279]|uniref:hypothetical protein n=1 Tax=Spirillospora sp. NPDC047279 TaxID=3155478 RepID=UPI00340B4909
MSHERASDDLDALLSRTIASVVSATPSGPREEVPTRAEGHDPEGLVRAVVSTGGRVETVEFGQRAWRLGSQEIAERAKAAINAALDELEAAGTAAAAAGNAAGGADLLTQMRDAQDMSLRQLRDYTQSLQALMNSFGRD